MILDKLGGGVLGIQQPEAQGIEAPPKRKIAPKKGGRKIAATSTMFTTDDDPCGPSSDTPEYDAY